MPSILEEVQPSWVEDGWGIQGEQDEYRFDDDLPWDITAWTRDQQTQDQDQLCCGKPFDCLSPDLPEIVITFDGVTVCFPDPDLYPPEDLINGSFTILNVGFGHWFGGIHYCRNSDSGEWRVTAEACEDGEEQRNQDFDVTCVDGLMNVFDIYEGSSGFFSNPSSAPPTAVNTRDCFFDIGAGGTATITVP